MSKEYIIYCDESIDKGRFFSHFYGGALLRSQDLREVQKVLIAKKNDLNLHNEIKWSKVTYQYLDKYIGLMEAFFDFIEADIVKIRIMFTQNCNIPNNLSTEQTDNEYFLLYYQFLKHAFGLQYSNQTDENIRLRMYLDDLPDTREKAERLKKFLLGLNKNPQLESAGIYIDENQIAEVRSHNHPIIQYLDVVLGAMQFRLNNKHKEKPDGARFRAKRTIAKEKLYTHIYQRISKIYPRFNIGVSTSVHGDVTNKWNHPYRHWLFKPEDFSVDTSKTKSNSKI
ncbi:DUF3800 domain-containing protein [Nostoc sp.]|uniref:DUF3800 domain-containing protein n=1 Tax=Nostoc sp. TaxID=1180 RepID=UPI002FF53C9D